MILINQTLIKWNKVIGDKKAILEILPPEMLGDLVAA
jgi:hypothetical protein